jgi:uncharacterized protein DUF1761
MPELNYPAIVVAAIVVLVVSTVYYMIFAGQMAELNPVYAATGTTRPPAWKLIVELGRSLIVALVLAGLAAGLGVAEPVGAAQLGFALWIAFPVVLLAGSVIWEGVPWRLAVIHAGDWLVKLLAVAVIVGVWR